MKNLKLVVLGIALIANTMVFAQDEKKMSVEEKSDKITAKLTEELELTSNQSSEVKVLTIDFMTKKRDLHEDASLTKEEKKKALKSAQKDKKAKMESILSKEQLAKLEAMHKDKKEHGKKMSPTDKATKITDKLDETVSLTTEQREKVHQTNLNSVIEIEKVKQNKSLSEEDRKIEVKKIRKAKKEEIKSILTEEQLKKLKEVKATKKDEKKKS